MADIVSPLPGVFYHRPSPDEATFKSNGDAVSVGDTIGLVEAMKTFIEIKSEISGTFDSYVASDGAPVSPAETLAKLDD